MNSTDRRQRVLATILPHIESLVNQFLDFCEANPEADLSALEEKARELNRIALLPLLQAAINAKGTGFQLEPPLCRCGQKMEYKGTFSRSVETYLGPVQLERAYYHCPLCHQGSFPLDRALRLESGGFSDGVKREVCRLACQLPFRRAKEIFVRLTGVYISGREVEEIAEHKGRQLEEKIKVEVDRALGEERGLSQGISVQVMGVAIDGAKVLTEEDWKEVKTGCVFKVERGEEPKAVEASYTASFEAADQAMNRLYAEALKRGVEKAEVVIGIGDGAPWIWERMNLHFPQAIQIVDWYHASEHIWAAAQKVIGEGKEEASLWARDRVEELWEGEVELAVEGLRDLAQRGEEKGQFAAGEIHYFEANGQRMRYKEFRQRGYPIGSGVVESACKQLVEARMKGSGMRWTKKGGQAILNLRAELLSERFDQTWESLRCVA